MEPYSKAVASPYSVKALNGATGGAGSASSTPGVGGWSFPAWGNKGGKTDATVAGAPAARAGVISDDGSAYVAGGGAPAPRSTISSDAASSRPGSAYAPAPPRGASNTLGATPPPARGSSSAGISSSGEGVGMMQPGAETWIITVRRPAARARRRGRGGEGKVWGRRGRKRARA
jgi:hypothetical protein